MGFRFRKRIRIAPGLAININKSGVSTSIGGKGSTINIGKKGVKMTNGLPGTGLSHTTNLYSPGKSTEKKQLTHKQKIIRNILFVIIVFIIIKAQYF
ncbi:DUF4236 domain-containing protein [Escherichia coli]|uniref:DUF4236 domain-containing protein n=1 Tax=Escherichia sp. WS553 TaxID=3382005 RepID=UPI0017713C78|nr:DUF4236 domain-containing protein [Escherichia coli]HAG9135008.1 DUF4236 domain-containing protein [Escherichia coli]HAJ6715235.1 DUF4236 domain-containing protein [Escherichia coli]